MKLINKPVSTDGKDNMNTLQRHAMVIRVKADKLDYYKQLHADPWPGVLDQLDRPI